MLPEQQATGATAERLWRFANAVYANAAVAKACIQAQDAHGFDVNLLLFAAWCADEGRALEAAQLVRASARCAAWRSEVVEALRRTRRRWKGAPERAADYTFIKELELAAERRQLSMLAELVEGPAFAKADDVAPSAVTAALIAANLAAAAAAQRVDPAVLDDLRQALGTQSAARKPPD